MENHQLAAAGSRDTKEFYADSDPMQWVSHSLIDEIRKRCGTSVLDLGCGVGGYSKVLQDAGYDVQAMDVHGAYVEQARSLGVKATQYDGLTIPLADHSVDSVFMIEVLEHIPDPARTLAEVHRVTRKNVILTVPNNTQRLNGNLSWSHMLDIDHKNFFTTTSLRALLESRFADVAVREIETVDHLVAKDLLSKWPHRMYRLMKKLGLEHDKLFFRLLAEGTK